MHIYSYSTTDDAFQIDEGYTKMGERTLGDTQFLELLLEHGANSTTEKGAPIFQIFSRMHCGVNKTYRAQIHHTITIWKSQNCTKALGCAVFEGRLDTVNYLIEDTQADFNIQDNDGSTPLSLASEHGYGDIVKILIDKGADINFADDHGMSPLYHAVTQNRMDVYKPIVNRIAELEVSGLELSPQNLELKTQVMPRNRKKEYFYTIIKR
ncbi:hypothetical protein TNIN_149281 [Trichonephila inaurata madagascariensis]|uniref:Alpha-latrotoxin n=1 Tax=Trichonephila inaurata madagascariensis TaxID=2747483 RepID=A0A8X7CLJ5_9ARAC|nr:hypothetical protein TNIN_149281 [Trichonephila inaurata madagascariensis]